MIFLAADETPLVLQGPRATIPPGWLESYWGVIVGGLVLVGALALLEWARRRRQRPPLTSAHQALEATLRQAAEATGPTAAALVSQGLREFLATTDPQLPTALSTQELAARLDTLPLYLPARSLLLTALQTADLAKFAGASASPDILIAQVREAVQRVETARRAFTGHAVAPTPVVLSTPLGATSLAVPATEPPPLPGPPPLTGKDRP